jgi:hypothetical protein
MPAQSPADADPFLFEYHGKKYRVEPKAEYTIRGLVVSHNDISAFADIYHTADSVDFRDICLVYGENLQSDVYLKGKFWSEPWSCHFEFGDSSDFREFNGTALSNNHLLTDDFDLQQTIQKFHRGDQVEIKGWLVDYSPAEASEQLRRTSQTRSDTGNGACEIVFVREARLLMPWMPGWHEAFRVAWKLFWVALIFRVIVALVFPYLEYRYG